MFTNNIFKKQNKSYFSFLVYATTFILLFITVIPLLLLCIYNHPSVLDDYEVFTQVRDGFDFIGTFFRPGYRYINSTYPPFLWSFSEKPTLVEMYTMLSKYKLFSLFIVLFFISSVFYVLKQLNSYILKLSKQYFLLFFALILFILINSVQKISTFFYSMISSVGYTFSLSCLLIFIGVLFKYHFSYKKKYFYGIFLTVNTFIINGGVEFYPVLLGFILFVYLSYFFIINKKINYFITFLFLFCFLVALTFISPPWLEFKRSVYARNVSDIHTVKRYMTWINDMYSYFKYNFFSYFNFKILPVMLGISYLILTRIKRKLYIEGAFLIYIISIVISYTLFYTGITEPTKHVAFFPVLNVLLAMNTIFIFTYFIQLLQNFCKKFLKMKYIKKISEVKNEIRAKIVASHRVKIYFFVFTVSYCFYVGIFDAGLPVRTAWKDILKGTAAEYDAKLKKRYAEMTDYSINTIQLEEILTPPSFYIDPIWSYQKFLDFPEDVNLRIGNFFNKTILVSPLDKENRS